MAESKTNESSPIRVGWITLAFALVFCFAWGLQGGFLMIMPDFLTMASIMLAMPLLLASFILAIVGMCKNRPGKGTILLVATLILPSVFVVIGTVASTMLPS